MIGLLRSTLIYRNLARCVALTKPAAFRAFIFFAVALVTRR
jgi:hypothetical protein